MAMIGLEQLLAGQGPRERRNFIFTIVMLALVGVLLALARCGS
jgi:hypothetical protein